MFIFYTIEKIKTLIISCLIFKINGFAIVEVSRHAHARGPLNTKKCSPSSPWSKPYTYIIFPPYFPHFTQGNIILHKFYYVTHSKFLFKPLKPLEVPLLCEVGLVSWRVPNWLDTKYVPFHIAT